MECKLCKYSTKRSDNFKRHCQSKGHLILKEKHDNTINKRKERKENKHKELLDELKNIKKTMNDRDKNTKKEFEIIKKHQLITDSKVNNINKGVKKITDYIEFLNEYCPDAKPLKLLTNSKVTKLLKLDDYNEYVFERKIISSMRCNKLHEKLGNLILDGYLKPDNPTLQMVWTSDVSRLIYLISQESPNDENNWIRDRRGEKITDLVTIPIINKIKEMMVDYKVFNLKNYDKEVNDDIKSDYLTNAQDATQFKSTIFCDKLKIDILKYMATKFALANKKEAILECVGDK